MLALTALSTRATEPPSSETYIARHGDTLSGIASRVLGDARRWREILSANPQVKNANLIYPGDSLLLPAPRPVAVEVGEQGAEEAPAKAGLPPAEESGSTPESEEVADSATAPELVPELPVEVVRAVPVISTALYRSAGYLSDCLPALAIIASQDKRILLGSGDVAIVNAPIPPGRQFTVVRADRRVFHPLTGQYLGWLTRVLGTAEVTCRGEQCSTVALQGMRDAAGVGDYLVPADPGDLLEENLLPGKSKPECLSAGPADAVIVAFDEDLPAVGEQELAYIDQGSASCVSPGQRFTIYREVAPDGRMVIGELQVLRAAERTATALITTSIQEIEVGSLLRAR